MIPGVELIPLTRHHDERGFFQEILRVNQIEKFGQWSMSWMTTGTIKAWHIHKIQTDYWFVVSGVVKAVLAQVEEKQVRVVGGIETIKVSKDIEEFILGDYQTPQVLVIPLGVAHGLKVLQGPAILVYVTSETYNQDDEGRIPYDALGYDWLKQDIR